VRLIDAHSSSEPVGGFGCRGAGSLRAPVAWRWQCACMRRVPSGGPSRPRVTTCLVIALRVVRYHCSHSCGLCGSRSACRSRSPQSGQRPFCLRSRRSVLGSSSGLLCGAVRPSSWPGRGHRGMPCPGSAGAGRSWSRRAWACRRRWRGRRVPSGLAWICCTGRSSAAGDPGLRLAGVAVAGPFVGELPHVAVQAGIDPG